MERNSESPGRRKRRREEVNGEEEEEKADTETAGTADEAPSLEDSLMFSDTSVALRIMRAQFPRIDKVSTEPFVLRSQLYSSVEDRTQVDRELETLKRENVLRVFKLNTGQDDHAVMFLEDYLKQIERVTKRLEEMRKGDTEVFAWFRKHVIDCKLEPSIGHEELWSLLSNGGKVKDAHISLLINAGLLGRKELLSLLNRRRYKEMMLALLEKKRLRMSPLDIRFHLRDLIGSGHLKTVSTPTGLVVRVLKD
ncbi:Serine/threonine-protein kinase 19 [Linum perenne]